MEFPVWSLFLEGAPPAAVPVPFQADAEDEGFSFESLCLHILFQ